MSSSSSSSSPPAKVQNTFFIPSVGIDREVITTDICSYLGNDALVRPGLYTNHQNGQQVQGYYITAYRTLTSAQLEDLRLDSLEWQEEKRNNPRAVYNYSTFDQVRTRQENWEVQPSPSADPADTPMVDV